MFAAEQLVALALAVPIGGAALIGLSGRWPNLREAITLVTATALFGCVLLLLPIVSSGTYPAWHLLTMLPGLDIAFQLEPLGMVFALVAAGLWIVNSVYSIG